MSMRESELRQELERLHHRLQRILEDLGDVRAKTAASAVDIENRAVFRKLRADENRAA
jgi:hypothetical protein